MLGGKISNQDEDEVEDELAALEAEIKRTEPLPNVPVIEPTPAQPASEPAVVAQPEPERQAMLA